MKTKIMLMLLCFVLAAGLVSAGGLEIQQIDVTVDGDKDKNIGENETIGPEADSESSVKFEITLENTYTDDEDEEIQDVEVTVTIYDIDDDDDLEETADEFDLKPEKDKEATINFDLPFKMDEGDYDVEVLIEAESENGTQFELRQEFYLEVEKERNNLVIRRAELSQPEMQCSRRGSVFVKVLNLGRDEEEEVAIEVRSDELGINYKETDIELTEDVFDDDSEYDLTVPISIADDVTAGTYSIYVKVFYDDDKLDDQETVSLLIKNCATVEPDPEPEPEPQPDPDPQPELYDDDQTTDDTTTDDTTTGDDDEKVTLVTIAPVAPTFVTPQKESFWDENGLLVVILLANFIAIVIGVWLVSVLIKK